MVVRHHRRGRLIFDRDAIVRAALRAYVEAVIGNIGPANFPPCSEPGWTGSPQRGAFYNGNGSGAYGVVAWTEAGVVGLAYELGFGPIEQLGLSVDAVTGGPDDVRGALPGLPDELEPALVIAVGMLGVGPEHGQRDAGVGFWLYGDRVAGTLFDDPTAAGADRLTPWGLLQNGRLPRVVEPSAAAKAAELDRTRYAPLNATLDAVVDRALTGPTELTTAELETLVYPEPDPERLLGAQRMLQKAGITWPGSPEIPPLPKPTGRNPFLQKPV
ncbi:hypothetical protein [Polyangium fumosum]|uniref:Uncharacterized protein n=1 Tax=Polyangium fumosum TaxID=889272 RepID=A0A4U1IMQ4_9BACT|nr:hypothetical protein [Polyangium fumosum]TKC95201.1 hypothetical protein E8A74_47385 [Polyangium fumosum]